MAVRIIITPINPRIQRKTPEMKKPRMINRTPMTKRKIPSPFPTFFIFTLVSLFKIQGLLIKTFIPFSTNGVSIHLVNISDLMG
jgi:hypothetical protein